MQTIWIADMMADYIISHKGEEYKIDLWEWDFYEIRWDGDVLIFHENLDGEKMVTNIPIETPTLEEIKNLILANLWVVD